MFSHTEKKPYPNLHDINIVSPNTHEISFLLFFVFLRQSHLNLRQIQMRQTNISCLHDSVWCVYWGSESVLGSFTPVMLTPAGWQQTSAGCSVPTHWQTALTRSIVLALFLEWSSHQVSHQSHSWGRDLMGTWWIMLLGRSLKKTQKKNRQIMTPLLEAGTGTLTGNFTNETAKFMMSRKITSNQIKADGKNNEQHRH